MQRTLSIKLDVTGLKVEVDRSKYSYRLLSYVNEKAEQMKKVSRRNMIGALGMLGASSMLPELRAVAEPATAQLKTLPTAERKRHADALLAYFKDTAPKLLRPPGGLMTYPSVAPSLPGKAYGPSLWDWDTLWTSRALFRHANLTNDREFRSKIGEHAKGSLFIFFANQREDGRMPIMILPDKLDFFGNVRKDIPANKKNQAKPVLGQLALLTSDEVGDSSWFGPYFDKLLLFYKAWTSSNMSQVGLLVWSDDVAIGDDNDPTTFGRPPFSSANLLLNCLFYEDLQAAAELASRLNRPQDAQQLKKQAQELGANLLKYCWDPRDKFFYTVDVQCVDHRVELIGYKGKLDMSWKCLPLRFQMFTGFLPMWCGLATADQANLMVQANYLADQRLRGNWGVRSLSNLESMYSLDFSSNPSNWLGPIWIIVNYLVWKGLKNYGYIEAANDLADKTIHLLANDLARNGSLNEYYHPDTGAALSHPGFMDWDMLVLEMI